MIKRKKQGCPCFSSVMLLYSSFGDSHGRPHVAALSFLKLHDKYKTIFTIYMFYMF